MTNPPNDAAAFQRWLIEVNACKEARLWSEGKTLQEAWESCERVDWLQWLLITCDYDLLGPQWDEFRRLTAPARAKWGKEVGVRGAAFSELQRVSAAALRSVVPFPFEVAEVAPTHDRPSFGG